MDNATTAATENIQVEFAWVLCLFTSSGDKDKCLPLTKSFVMNEATVMAVLYMLSLNGYWCVLFLGRYSMVTGWWETIKAPFNRSHDFVSVDARRISDPRNYEMLTSPPQPMMHKTIEDVESSPDTENHSARDWEVKNTREVSFGSEATYRSPALSFSSPKPPSRSASIEATRHGSSHGRSKDVTSWETDRVASPPILERYEPSSNRQSPILRTERSGSALGYERSGSAMGSERSDSALGRQHSGSALLREKNTRSPPQRSGISPASHLGREWDPRSTYARGTGVRTPERGGQPWNPSQTTYVRGGEGAPM